MYGMVKISSQTVPAVRSGRASALVGNNFVVSWGKKDESVVFCCLSNSFRVDEREKKGKKLAQGNFSL